MIETNIRKPAVAGRFYPKNKKELSATIEEIYSREKTYWYDSCHFHHCRSLEHHTGTRVGMA